MKKLDFGQTISLIANVGVIAGILLLVVEIRQNNDLLMEEAQRARSESIREAYIQMSDNGELARIFVKEMEGQSLDSVETFRLGAFYIRGLFGYQTSFYQLPPDELAPMLNWFRERDRESPTWRSTWEQNRTIFDPEFAQFIDENLGEPN